MFYKRSDLKVKLKRLKIESLHNLYNYEINFFDNVNILFGKNGCGKTTILNIINYIISGRLYKLRQYDFKLIELEFFNIKTEKIIIYKKEENLILEYNGEKTVCRKFENFDERHFLDPNKQRDVYFKKYKLLNEIRNVFNIVYLPLSREFEDYENIDRRLLITRYENDEISYLDKALEKAQNLVKEEFARLNIKVEEYEKELKSEIFEVMFADIDIKFKEVEFSEKIEKEILDYLKKFNFYNLNLEEKMIEFFKKSKKLREKYNDLQQEYKSLEANDDPTRYDEMLKVFDEILDVQSELILYSAISNQVYCLKEKFEEYNDKINNVMLPIRQFSNIVNNFFRHSSIPKEIFVSYDKIYLKMDGQDKKIEISDLSSGEKQIITFIAHFIFKVLPAEQPIFIVDEPEMSLHLVWQKNWISSIEELDNNIQLIIATHSPEIVADYRNNMIKIEPKIEG